MLSGTFSSPNAKGVCIRSTDHSKKKKKRHISFSCIHMTITQERLLIVLPFHWNWWNDEWSFKWNNLLFKRKSKARNKWISVGMCNQQSEIEVQKQTLTHLVAIPIVQYALSATANRFNGKSHAWKAHTAAKKHFENV